MPAEPIEPAAPRVVVDGKFFRAGGRRFHPKGVTYGPFAPGADGAMFPAPDTARRDFALVRELGANVLRVYHVPPRWLLDLAEERGLKLLVDIPWDKDAPFLATGRAQAEARVRSLLQKAG